MVSFATPIWPHIRHLARNLRQSDLLEIAAATGGDPLSVLSGSVAASSLCWTILDDNHVPISIFGCAPSAGPPHVGSVWMLGTPGMDDSPVGILRNSVPYIERMHEEYPVLHNFIDLRNVRSQRWLDWCGFTIIDIDMQHGVGRAPFLHFIRHQ